MEKGKIFDIQRYSTHDGPGIRTVVFLKGCPLRCAWCSNPESQKPGMTIMFQPSRCIGCKKCEQACPNGIKLGEQGVAEGCTLCGDCARACPSGALEIKGEEKTIAEIMDEVDRDASFYNSSGGGVTISGGEPLMQADFAVALADEVKRSGYHLAIETTGFAPWENARQVFEKIDLILYDVKHMDDAMHKEYTGVSNSLILENLEKAAKEGFHIIVRVPLIKGFNATDENMGALADKMKELGLREIDLLPYHTFGESKYKQMRREYTFKGEKPPQEDLDRFVAMFKEKGITASIGG
ncbi:glycyl-radical enzyme activating protein [Christensenellaceae bacterium OttesenSCG-928-K19]|nr:glycyl-radical enzyme activating protein [Christensenellaceae bacterium OttesenSCG-928-K19]